MMQGCRTGLFSEFYLAPILKKTRTLTTAVKETYFDIYFLRKMVGILYKNSTEQP